MELAIPHNKLRCPESGGDYFVAPAVLPLGTGDSMGEGPTRESADES